MFCYSSDIVIFPQHSVTEALYSDELINHATQRPLSHNMSIYIYTYVVLYPQYINIKYIYCGYIAHNIRRSDCKNSSETDVSRHHGDPIAGTRETSHTSQQYRIEGIKGGPNCSPIMRRDASLSDKQCRCFPVW